MLDGQEVIVTNVFPWLDVKMEDVMVYHWLVNAMMVGWDHFVTVLNAKKGVIWSMDIAMNLVNAIVLLDGVDLIVTFVSNILVVLILVLVLKLGIVSVKMKLMITTVLSKICLGIMIVTRSHT